MRYESSEYQTILSLVAAGLGVTVVPASVSTLRRAGVSFIRLRGVDAAAELTLVHRPHRRSRTLDRFASRSRCGSGALADLPTEYDSDCGQRQGESAPRSRPALHCEVTAHAACEVAADRQAEPYALVRPRQTLVHLHERLEYGRQFVGRLFDAGVRHRDGDPAVPRLARHADFAHVGELDGVREQVEQDSLQLLPVRLQAERRRTSPST